MDTYLTLSEYIEAKFATYRIRYGEWNATLAWDYPPGTPVVHAQRFEKNNNIGGLYNFQYNLHYAFWQMDCGQWHTRSNGWRRHWRQHSFLYNMRNGNNPAQAYLNVNLSPSASAAYAFRFVGQTLPSSIRSASSARRFDVCTELRTKLLRNIFRATTTTTSCPPPLVSTPSLRQMLTPRFLLCTTPRCALAIWATFQQACVNGLKYHTWSNLLVVVGIVRKFSSSKIIP